MDRLAPGASNGAMATTNHTAPPGDAPGGALAEASLAHPTWDDVMRRIALRTYCVLGTSSPAHRPHTAGVLYAEADGALYISIERDSRKGRNIAANPHVSVNVPIRRLPVGPPATAMYASTAEILAIDDPHILELAGSGRIKGVTSHGELEHPAGCFVRIAPPTVVHTYGLGLSVLTFIRNPLRAAGRVERP